jgi:hypothetical protein
MKSLIYIVISIYIKYKMSKKINERVERYVEHKTTILIKRVYLSIKDKIFDAENNDEYKIDSDNNIYIRYSTKRDELIIVDAHDLIIEQIIRSYRKKLEKKLEDEGYFVEYDDTDINVYFEQPLKISNSSEQNILTYKKTSSPTKLIEGKAITNSEDSDLFNFGEED